MRAIDEKSLIRITDETSTRITELGELDPFYYMMFQRCGLQAITLDYLDGSSKTIAIVES